MVILFLVSLFKHTHFLEMDKEALSKLYNCLPFVMAYSCDRENRVFYNCMTIDTHSLL